MRIAAILKAGAILWVLVLIALGSGLYLSYETVTRARSVDGLAREVGRTVLSLTALTGEYVLHGEARAREQWFKVHDLLGQTLGPLNRQTSEDAKRSRAVAQIRDHHVEIGQSFWRLIAVGPFAGEKSDIEEQLERRLVTGLLIRIRAIEEAAVRLETLSRAAVTSAMQFAIWLFIGLVASIVATIAVSWLVLVRRIALPIGKVRVGIEAIGDGDLDYRIGGLARDEIGAIATAIDTMAENLRKTLVSRDQLERDVQKRKRTESKLRAVTEALERKSAQLEATNAELEAFAYSVSHDLRAPLRSINGFSQALVEDYGDELDDDAKDHIRRMSAAAVRMGQLIDDILKLSRVTRGNLEFAEVDLTSVAHDVAARLKASDPNRDVSITIASGVTGNGDSNLLRVVLENLLGNAWKFTAKQAEATLEFGVDRSDDRLVYYVRDNGAGFDMAYADKLFKPFQRLHADSEFEGTGIGLATVARIVRRHGGRIWADSSPGQGTTISFTLSADLMQEAA